MKKKIMSMFLCILLTAGMITVLEIPVFAGSVSREQAVAWARSVEGKTDCDIDGNGKWCVDLATAYMNYLWNTINDVTSSPWRLYNPYTTYNANQYDNQFSSNSNWTVLSRNSNTTPMPGDLFVSEQDDYNNGVGHIGVILEVYSNTRVEVIEMSGGKNPYISTITLGSSKSYNAEHLIRFNYFTIPTYSLDVNVYVDGTAYKSGYSGVTFDVRINEKWIKTGVADFYGSYNDGSVNDFCVGKIKYPSKYVLSGNLTYYGDYWNKGTSAAVINVYLITPTLSKTVYLNGNKYEFYTAKTPWINAQAFAEAKGGHLATITSQAEQVFIVSNNTYGDMWLGATDKDSEGKWKWVTGESFEYTNWDSIEPNNYTAVISEGEDFMHICKSTGKWNDTTYYTSAIVGFIVEYDHTHIWDSGKVTKAATCTASGIKTYICSNCGTTKTDTITALGHDYISTRISATCTESAYMQYKCSRCGDSYTNAITGSYVYSNWSETKPAFFGNITIEQKTQYRYKTGMEGYTDWVESGSGTHYYFTRPSGFKSSAYTNYASSALSSSENATSKRIVSTAQHNSYIYWHWGSPTSYGVGTNCYIGEYEGESSTGAYQPFTVWEAFENGSDLTETIIGTANRVQGHSKYSYWWFKTETFKQKYTDYMRSTEITWSDWSVWSDAAVTESPVRQIETRTLYRTKTPVAEEPALGHTYDSGKVTKAATYKEDGIRTYTCTVCKATRKESIPKLVRTYTPGDADGDGKITAADARLALRQSVGLEKFAPVSDSFLACDVDFDGKVTAADARLILRYAVGLEDRLSAVE